MYKRKLLYYICIFTSEVANLVFIILYLTDTKSYQILFEAVPQLKGIWITLIVYRCLFLPFIYYVIVVITLANIRNCYLSWCFCMISIPVFIFHIYAIVLLYKKETIKAAHLKRHDTDSNKAWKII